MIGLRIEPGLTFFVISAFVGKLIELFFEKYLFKIF
jgi:hypothetical protein